MSKGLASLISVLGAAGSAMSGYAKGRAQFQEGERQKLLDGRQDEEYAHQQGQRTKAQALEQSLIDSQADIGIEEVPGTDPNYNVASMAGLPEPGTPAPAAAGFKVGAQTFGDRGAAQQALHGINSQAAKYQRAAKALAEKGQIEQAQKYEAFAKSAISEGTDQILGAISATAPKVEDVKKAGGMVAGTIGAQAAEIYNKTGGKWSVSADTVIQHFVDKDSAGREFVNSRVLGKDGKPVVEDVRAAGMMLADFKTRLAQQNADTDTFQKGQQQAETGRHNKAVEVETASNNRAARAQQAAQTGIQAQRLEMERNQFKKQTPQGQIETIEEITGVKLSVEEKKQFLGIGKGKKDGKSDEITAKLVADSVKTFHENNPTATTGQIATFRAKLVSELEPALRNVEVESALRQDFAGLKPDSPAYAKAYQNAQQTGRMSDADLASRGYAPPKGSPARMAAQGTARIPSPPPQKIWVGNSHQTNPAYTQWEQQYGGTVRKQEAGENARLVNAYERVRN